MKTQDQKQKGNYCKSKKFVRSLVRGKYSVA